MRTSIGARNIKKWSINYNSKGYVKIPRFKVEAGDEFHCQVIIFASDEPVSYSIIDGKSSRMKIGFATNSTGIGVSLVSTRNVRAFVDNVEIPHTTSVTSAEVNTVINLKLIFTETHYLEVLGASIAYTEILNGRTFNIRMKSKNEERYYPSVINATRKPSINYLQDALNTYRRNTYVLKSITKTQFIPIAPWRYDVGDSIIVGFVWLNEISTWNNILDADISDVIKRPYFGIDTLNNLSWNRDVFYDPTQLNGQPVEKPIPGKHYTYIIKIKIKGSPIGTVGNNVGSRLEAFSGYLTRLELINKKDTRNYKLTVQADIQPNAFSIKEINSGEDIAIKGINDTKRQKIIYYSTPSHYQSILPKTISVWSNELSTDGELINFKDQHWVEF